MASPNPTAPEQVNSSVVVLAQTLSTELDHPVGQVQPSDRPAFDTLGTAVLVNVGRVGSVLVKAAGTVVALAAPAAWFDVLFFDKGGRYKKKKYRPTQHNTTLNCPPKKLLNTNIYTLSL